MCFNSENLLSEQRPVTLFSREDGVISITTHFNNQVEKEDWNWVSLATIISRGKCGWDIAVGTISASDVRMESLKRRWISLYK